VEALGQRRKKRLKFFQSNPWCCFCGGSKPATTIDHTPQRSMFDNRIWPEGYEFPACDDCNHRTGNDELLVAMLAKVRPAYETGATTDNFMELVAGVRNNHPEVFNSIGMLGAAERKRLIRERGIPVPVGMLPSELPIVSLRHPAVAAVMDAFAAKLLMALHYRHTGTILPKTGLITYRWYTNADTRPEALDQVLKVLKGSPELRRQTTSLKEQFDYRFAVESNMRTAAFLVEFATAFYIFGLTTSDPDTHEWADGVRKLRPFQ